MTDVNAQPQVRSGSLPTQTPRTIQRPAQPQAAQAAEQPAEAAQTAEGAETPAAKPKRQYKPRKPKAPAQGLSSEEFATLADIAMEAKAANLPVEQYMTDLETSVGLKLQVWAKVKPAAIKQVSESPEQPVVEA